LFITTILYTKVKVFHMDAVCLGTLMYVNEDNLPPVIISKRNFVIGRARDCDLSLDNRKVSGHHCYLKTHENGDVYLYDTSSNGTLLNKNRLTHGQYQLLHSGDEFRIVFKEGMEDPDGDGDQLNDTEEYDFKLTTCETECSIEVKPEILASTVDGGNARSENAVDTSMLAPNTEEKKEVVDEIEDHLICSICQEILYKPISLQPCMHCFCSGCYSDWMDLSAECPQCRINVQRIAPNHMVGNLVEAYLKLHPDKQRDEDDIQEMEAKNKITHDMLYIKRSDFESASKLDTSSSDSQDEALLNFPFTAIKQKRGNKRNQHRKICRQCSDEADTPQAKQRKKENNGGSSNSKIGVAGCSQPSTSHSATGQVAFVCKPGTHHVHCSCCFEYMPDRSRDRLKDPAIPPQTCELCPVPSLHYCHMYWGCKVNGHTCTGCLAPLKDVVFGENCLDYVINVNQYESDVLKDYLKGRKMSWKELFRHCIASLDAGEYVIDATTFHQPPNRNARAVIVNSNTPVCKFCAHKCLAQLSYQYRSNIPKKDLKDEVTRREDCYWGRNCRSQTKIHHARNFNHICEQTRFT